MRCRNCGKESPEGRAYCIYCGAMLEQDEEKKKGSRYLPVLIGMGAAAILLGVIIVILLAKPGGPEESGPVREAGTETGSLPAAEETAEAEEPAETEAAQEETVQEETTQGETAQEGILQNGETEMPAGTEPPEQGQEEIWLETTASHPEEIALPQPEETAGDPAAAMEELVTAFLHTYTQAMDTHDPEPLKSYMTGGSLYQEMSEYVVNKGDNRQELLNCRVTALEPLSDTEYAVYTEETYYITQNETSEELSESEREEAMNRFGDVDGYRYHMERTVVYTAAYRVLNWNGEWKVDSIYGDNDYEVIQKEYAAFTREAL